MITLYSTSDFAYQTLRLLVLAGLCQYLSIAYGLLMYLLIQQGIYKIMLVMLQCENLTAQDTMQLLDKPDCVANTMGFLTFEKYDTEEMKKQVLSKAGNLDRCRSKLINIFGLWWYQRMSDEEWEVKKKKIISIKEDVHNETQLLEYIEKEMTIREPFDNPQFRCIFIPDYQPDKGLIILKFHHSFSDGLGVSSFILYLSDQFDGKHLPGMKPFSFMKKLAIEIQMPFRMLTSAFKVFVSWHNPPTNVMKRGQKLSGVKKAAFKEFIDLEQFKKYAKLKNCSVNDYASALLSTSFHEYFTKFDQAPDGKRYPVPDSILYCMPFSLREPIEHLKDIRVTNEISGTVLEMPIRKDIESAITDFKSNMNTCLSALDPFSMRRTTMIAAMLPYTLSKQAVDFMSSKVTMMFTNLNASKVNYKICGKECKSIMIMAQTAGDINCIVMLVTMGNVMSLSCIGDENVLQHPQEFMDMVVKNHQKNVKTMILEEVD